MAFFMNLIFLNLIKLSVNNSNSKVLFNTFTGISLLQFSGLIFHKIVIRARLSKRMILFFISKYWRQTTEDEMEHLEMAEAEGEIELESNEEEQLENEDTNNLST